MKPFIGFARPWEDLRASSRRRCKDACTAIKFDSENRAKHGPIWVFARFWLFPGLIGAKNPFRLLCDTISVSQDGPRVPKPTKKITSNFFFSRSSRPSPPLADVSYF